MASRPRLDLVSEMADAVPRGGARPDGSQRLKSHGSGPVRFKNYGR